MWLRRISGEDFTGAATRGVAGGTVAGVNETEQNRNFQFTNPELPVFPIRNFLVYKPGTSGFWTKQIQFWSVQN